MKMFTVMGDIDSYLGQNLLIESKNALNYS